MIFFILKNHGFFQPWRQAIERAVDENCQLVLNQLSHLQPLQLLDERHHMVVPPPGVDQSCGSVQHGLQPISWKTSLSNATALTH